MIPESLMQYVPGCENGDAPYSQELIGGGKVNRSFLVRTRRGRFVVRLNESAASDPGLDRERELALHGAAANAGIAPHIVYAAPDHSCLMTDFVDGRLWTPHYFTRMRDLRSLGQRLRALQAVPAPDVERFDPLVAARRYADIIVRADPDEAGRIQFLLAHGAEALARSGSAKRAQSIVHSDLHHGNVLTADRVYFIDWEYAQVGDPLLDLAAGTTPEMLGELANVFTLLTYLWYRARRVARTVPGTDLQLESAALRRLLSLAPDAQPRHTSAANSRESTGAGKRNGDAAGD
jgi:aminoglycoside phosphotransferase (APT) family kinase protein